MTSGELADATIVFDLDGTLVDTAPDIMRALNQTMDLEGLAARAAGDGAQPGRPRRAGADRTRARRCTA